MAKKAKQSKPATPTPPAPARVGMIDFTEVPHDNDGWELFARDFLVEQGFHIESPPNRGPDQGKDLQVTDQLKGRVGNYRMRW